MDQADTLRALMKTRPTRTISFMGSMHGVGVTSLSTQLAYMIGRSGVRCEFIDALAITAKYDPSQADLVLFDCGSGELAWSMVPASLSSRVAIVVTAEPKQLNQARALVSRVRTLKPQMEIGVAVNRVTTSGKAIAVFRDLSHGLNLDYLGHCPEDEKFAQAVTGGKYLLDYDIGAPSYRCLETLAQRMKPLTVPIQEETETSAQRMRGVIG